MVKFYPSSFSQLLDGLDGIFQRPYGCFEQTSSCTYPNLLALDYLRRTKTTSPEVEAKARLFVHLGYQRLLTFEVDGGGFDWFGNPPANLVLTAYGLMEFRDMARVHDVDPDLIRRTRAWLLERQQADGSWFPTNHRLHDDPTGNDPATIQLSTTAYVAWSVFEDSPGEPGADRAMDFLIAHSPDSIDDSYVLAQVANALLAIDRSGSRARPYVEELNLRASRSADGKLAWWSGGRGRTAFYGDGRYKTIETTALAAMAMIPSSSHPETIRAALAWLVEQKDTYGTWGSTQATVLALKALLAGTGRPLGESKQRRLEIALGSETIRSLTIPADQGDVMQQIDLSALIPSGASSLVLRDRSTAASGYQVALAYHLPEEEPAAPQAPFSIDLHYDRTELAVNDTVTATATVRNHQSAPSPMVLVDLPIPPGFAVEADDLAILVSRKTIAKFDLTPRSIVVYLRGLSPGEPIKIDYHLKATMPVKVTTPPASAHEYYDPDKRAAGKEQSLTVLSQGV